MDLREIHEIANRTGRIKLRHALELIMDEMYKEDLEKEVLYGIFQNFCDGLQLLISGALRDSQK